MSEDSEKKKEQDESSSSSGSDSDDESGDEIGPLPPSAAPAGEEGGDEAAKDEDEPPSKKPKTAVKRLPFEKEYLQDLPCSERYEKSFMHRDVVTKVVVASGGFVMTGSVDGHVKFWKKDTEGFEFVKHFRAHLGPVVDMAVNASGTLLATVSSDKHVKVFDVQNFDMINIIKLEEVPWRAEWIHRSDDVVPALAVVSSGSKAGVRIYDGKGESSVPVRVLDKIHFRPVVALKYNPHFDTAISVDEGGMVEYWHGPQGDYEIAYEGGSSSGKKAVMFESKLDTDLFDMAKAKTCPISIDVSPKDGKLWAALCTDRKIRIFRFLSGKLYLVIDETLNNYIKLQAEKKMFQAMDFNRKVSNEKDLEKVPEHGSGGGQSTAATPISGCNVVFDKTGNFILYPTMIGVKTVNIFSNKVCGTAPIGNGENLRFLNIALSQGSDDLTQPSSGASNVPSSIEQHVSDNPGLAKSGAEPILFCTAHKKNRFYLFTRSLPRETTGAGSDRDVFNEKPSQEERLAAVTDADAAANAAPKLYEAATIHTSMGDIFVKLFPRECPKTVENFCALARSQYFNGCIFHRVIKQFMLQTGDPTGIGTGGESTFGHEFEDEFHPKLKHDRPYTLSMANAGPNTNGSQFFVTVVPTPWLDNKHTVFGRVTKGMDVVNAISNVKTHPKTDKPYDEVSMVSVSLREPFRT